MTPAQLEMRSRAAEAIRRGLSVIVVNAGTKTPFKGAKGVPGATSKTPTRDLAVVDRLLDFHGEAAAVAAVFGPMEGGGYAFAIDYDAPDKARKSKEENNRYSAVVRDEVSAEFKLPATFEQVSKSGCVQQWFRSPSPVPARAPGKFLDLAHVEILGITGTGTPEYALLYKPMDANISPATPELLEAIGTVAPPREPVAAAPVAAVDRNAALAWAEEHLRSLGNVAEGNRNNTLNNAAVRIRERGLPYDQAAPLLQAWGESLGLAAEGTAATIRSAYTSERIAEGSAAPESDFSPIARDEAPAGKPDAIHTDKPLHELATLGERALVAVGVPFFVQGPRLVRPVVEDTEAADGKHTTVARLVEVSPDALVDHLSRAVAWVRYDARSKKTVSTDPPRSVAGIILARDGEWTFRRLAGVITTPTLRPDGSLLGAPGYDAPTRLLLVDPPAMPTIADLPTKADAQRALAELEDLLRDFPFVNEASRSVALSCLITPVVRGALPVAPLHAVRAPAAGSGKSFLIDVASAIATGQLCPVISAGASEEEAEKRLGSAVLTGQPIVSIDNLNGDLGGDALCQFIERPVVEVRPLGRSELIRIESRATIFATGNNLSPRGDVVRRVLLCSLDANLERPELRQFGADPLKKVLADRGRYVAACLVIVRAYLAAGCPAPRPVLASFGPWSKLVRSALVWLGRADPVDTMEAARDEDPETAGLVQIVEAWQAVVGAEAVTAGELVARTFAPEAASLRDALSLVAGDKGHLGSLKLAHWLKRYGDRVVNGMKIVGRRDPKLKQTKWSLQPVAGVAGVGGSISSSYPVSVTDKFIAWAEKTPVTPANTRQTPAEEPESGPALGIFN